MKKDLFMAFRKCVYMHVCVRVGWGGGGRTGKVEGGRGGYSVRMYNLRQQV